MDFCVFSFPCPHLSLMCATHFFFLSFSYYSPFANTYFWCEHNVYELTIVKTTKKMVLIKTWASTWTWPEQLCTVCWFVVRFMNRHRPEWIRCEIAANESGAASREWDASVIFIENYSPLSPHLYVSPVKSCHRHEESKRSFANAETLNAMRIFASRLLSECI